MHTLISCPINSSIRINLLLDDPLNNDQFLNTRSPAVLRQYYGEDVDTILRS